MKDSQKTTTRVFATPTIKIENKVYNLSPPKVNKFLDKKKNFKSENNNNKSDIILRSYLSFSEKKIKINSKKILSFLETRNYMKI